jgi:hypothetical protein
MTHRHRKNAKDNGRPRVVAFACDVGGRGNFDWARAVHANDGLRIDVGTEMDQCVAAVQSEIHRGSSLAIGFECPLFLPVPSLASELCRGRSGEGDRSVFAQAGAAVATLGFHQLAFFLQATNRKGLTPVLDPREWRQTNSEVLFWEAFVSGKAHSQEHSRDAATAAAAFMERLHSGRLVASDVDVKQPSRVLSIVGCTLLWARWSGDLRLLEEPVLVIRPDAPYSGTLSFASSASYASSASEI